MRECARRECATETQRHRELNEEFLSGGPPYGWGRDCESAGNARIAPPPLKRRGTRRMRAGFMFSLLAGSAMFAQICGAIEPKGHKADLSIVDNGVVRLGVDLNAGGAVTYLSKSAEDNNIINSWDWGRQVQM